MLKGACPGLLFGQRLLSPVWWTLGVGLRIRNLVRADTQKWFSNVSTNDNYIQRGLAPFHEGQSRG